MNTWQVMWEAVASDFQDLDAARAARIGTRLLMAAVFGGLIGFERQWKGKRAGLRTHMLVALGAALFVILPHAADSPDATSRVIQGVAAGIGFLGAGAIVKDARDTVKGLTTAADIWLTAAIGVAAGLGRGSTALLTTALALVILAVLPRFERWASPESPKTAPGSGELPVQQKPAT
jgi:putative Mg2+ transporter-C (MgtC) family protein